MILPRKAIFFVRYSPPGKNCLHVSPYDLSVHLSDNYTVSIHLSDKIGVLSIFHRLCHEICKLGN